MSIHPNRVLARIIDQVEQSGWLPLESSLHVSGDGTELIRVYATEDQSRYATPFHFWVHALRDELMTRSRGQDLMGVAGYALCQTQSLAELVDEMGSAPAGRRWLDSAIASETFVYRMQANECRRSSVAHSGERLMAYFWRHGFEQSWRRPGLSGFDA